MDYLAHVFVLCAIYSILATSLDLLIGHAGMLSMAQGAFYCVGAYSTALLVTVCQLPFEAGVLGGLLFSALVSGLVSLPSLRLHGDYFVIATFGFQMIVFSVFNNWIELTRGPLGISGIPRPVILGWHVDSPGEFVLLALAFALIALTAANRISSSPFGRVLRTIREDEYVACALGKNPMRFKVIAFGVSAVMASSAGSVYAHYVTYIDPSSFTVMESILVICMVIVGGAGSRWGPLVGAMVLVTLPEALRFIGLPNAFAANLRQLLYGSLLVTMMMLRPQGLIGEHAVGRTDRSVGSNR